MQVWTRWIVVSLLSIGTVYAGPSHGASATSQEKARIAKAYREVSATVYWKGVVGLWHLVERCYMMTVRNTTDGKWDQKGHRVQQPYQDQARVCYLEDIATTKLAHKWQATRKDVPLSYPKDDASLWSSDNEASLRFLFYGLLLFDTTEEKDAFLNPKLPKFLVIPYTYHLLRKRKKH